MSQSSSLASTSSLAERRPGQRARPPVDAQLDAALRQRARAPREERLRDVRVHEQRLGRVADARPLRLRIDGDRQRLLEVGGAVHVDVAVARRRIDHRHRRDALERLLQPLAAARDDQVDAARLRRQLGQLLAPAAGDERHAALRQALLLARPAPRPPRAPRWSAPPTRSRAARTRCPTSGTAPRRRSSRSAAPRRRPPRRRAGRAPCAARARSPAARRRSPRRPDRAAPRPVARPSAIPRDAVRVEPQPVEQRVAQPRLARRPPCRARWPRGSPACAPRARPRSRAARRRACALSVAASRRAARLAAAHCSATDELVIAMRESVDHGPRDRRRTARRAAHSSTR